MFMFYKIGNKYYVLVGNKYAEVTFKVEGNDVHAVPTSSVIEKTPNLKVIEKVFNDDFKKEIINSKKSFNDNRLERETEHHGRSRFDR